jgi:hypothetical protein
MNWNKNSQWIVLVIAWRQEYPFEGYGERGSWRVKSVSKTEVNVQDSRAERRKGEWLGGGRFCLALEPLPICTNGGLTEYSFFLLNCLIQRRNQCLRLLNKEKDHVLFQQQSATSESTVHSPLVFFLWCSGSIWCSCLLCRTFCSKDWFYVSGLHITGWWAWWEHSTRFWLHPY